MVQFTEQVSSISLDHTLLKVVCHVLDIKVLLVLEVKSSVLLVARADSVIGRVYSAQCQVEQ